MHTQILEYAPSDPAARADWARRNTRTCYVPHKVVREDRADGAILLRSGYHLPDHATNTGAWLHEWAEKAPYRVAVSERPVEGPGWRNITYLELLQQVRSIASSLLARGLGEGDTIAMLSGNGLDHLLLSLAAQYIGVPVVPLAEQYSLIPEAHDRLIYVLDKVAPKLAFVDDANRYESAIALPQLADVEVVAARGRAVRPVTPLSELLKGDDSVDLEAARAKVGPDTLAKILFTSGSSSDPKGVLTTHRMMCVNQVQMQVVLPFLMDHAPRITDWLPWNHVFGGSHNVNMMLAHGGTLTIDSGKPTGKGFATTLKNRTDRPGTLAFNVPAGWSMLVEAIKDDPAIQTHLFKDQLLLFYAGASLPQNVWEALEQFCVEARGGLPMMISSWGLTETAPACLMVHEPIGRSGVIGVPLPGVEVKLIPDDDMRCEIRVKGPNVMQGYFNDPKKTVEAFDEEGYFITGDAVRFVDPDDADRGLIFDGRVSEDFKLDTGTWVQAGNLRMTALKELAGLAQDVVICGHDRGEVGLFIFPVPAAARSCEVTHGAVTDTVLMTKVALRLREMNAHVTGSAKRITRAIVLAEPPSLVHHEISDKGSLNIKKILTRRANLLERLYDNEDPGLIRV
ncbi:feruloyl-CoA synthase [Paracoccus saliphilus]|uniref:Feruloyl-CoA synthase n=1 Tax=Paracoccus saliphilus TaxID=405559 RepID=A0AA45W7Y0_9RHOB|nr:feruloyl-CoA synthase [Paracoccus saliphilus]WCR01560.1 feruloyl-CoA synthase [Paracoccus saliphilus]SIT12411.1 feruloyl-CoA synthase [Paracoccus saliphilus]